MNNALIAIGDHGRAARECHRMANVTGWVEVDHGETVGRTPAALASASEARTMGTDKRPSRGHLSDGAPAAEAGAKNAARLRGPISGSGGPNCSVTYAARR